MACGTLHASHLVQGNSLVYIAADPPGGIMTSRSCVLKDAFGSVGSDAFGSHLGIRPADLQGFKRDKTDPLLSVGHPMFTEEPEVLFHY